MDLITLLLNNGADFNILFKKLNNRDVPTIASVFDIESFESLLEMVL